MIKPQPQLASIAPYAAGQSPEQIRRLYGLDNVLKLASNENPFGSSPRGIEAAQEAIRSAHRYADGGVALRERLAVHHGCAPENISVHNGSDAIIHQIMRTFLLPGETAVSSHGGFVSFGIAVRSMGNEAVYVPMAPGYRFDVEALAKAVTERTKVVYLPNPNNPTGTFVTADELGWLASTLPATVLLVVDEAYHEYASHLEPERYPDATTLGRPNVIALRTFSKAYGLAALRIGYAVGHPDTIQWLLRTKLPFDPNGPACAAAIAALDDTDFVRRTVTTNAEALAILSAGLTEAGFDVVPSVANFVMIDCHTPETATALHRGLLHGGFITRPLTGFGLPHCLRISTGTVEQMTSLVDVLPALAPSLQQ